MPTELNKTRPLVPPVLFTLMVITAFFPVLDAGFINYDDQEYVSANPAIAGGMSVAALKRAFTAVHSFNWHPLTWVSHLLDVQLYGLNPGGHHLTNLLIHVVNGLLVALLFRRLTGSPWVSWASAALFAIHPLRVESVAWVAERKDLLCGLFWLLTLIIYLDYGRTRTIRGYLLVAGALVCSLLSKPMAVTLPLVLLLLDLWPLGRLLRGDRRLSWPVLAEKLPLLACSLAVSLITLKAQSQAINAVAPAARLQNALCSYVTYMGKLLFPVDLAPFYPYRPCALWHAVAAALFLATVTILCMTLRNKRPQFLVGWLWYLVTLLPVIGIIQVGNQALADRYTYLPCLGLLLMIAGMADSIPAQAKGAAAVIATALIIVLGSLTFVQARYWHDSVTLFRHTLTVTEGNFLAHYNLASALFKANQLPEAELHFSRAIEIEPDYCLAWSNLGALYGTQGRIPEAAEVLEQAITCDPMNADAHYNMALVWIHLDNRERARHEYQVLSNLQPESAERLLPRLR